jgi:hypothetical protein
MGYLMRIIRQDIRISRKVMKDYYKTNKKEFISHINQYGVWGFIYGKGGITGIKRLQH